LRGCESVAQFGTGGLTMNHKAQRAALMNAIIYEVATTGRRFFSHASNISYLELDARGRVWFVDSYTERRIYTHYSQRWRGFTNGGTMRALVQTMRDFITGAREGATADAVMGHFGPWPDWYNGGDPWGYGEAMPSLRERVRVLMKSPDVRDD